MRIEAAVTRETQEAPAIEEVELEAPRPNEMLVRIVATGICHTDLNQQGPRGRTPKPVVLGHEGAGVVERVGDLITEFAPGDHVVLSGSSCGHCWSCLENHPTTCVEAMPRAFGGARGDGSTALSKGGERISSHFFGQSSFARYAVCDERTAVKVPRDVPLEMLGPLACGVITGSGAVLEAFRLHPGQSIAVFGAGGVGLSAVMAAKLAGASRIIAVDLVPARLELARQLGATDVVDAKAGDAARAIREITGRGVDFSFNTTLAPAVFTQALDCLAMRGTAGFVTAPAGEWAPNMYALLAGSRRMQWILGGDAPPKTFIPMLIDYWRQGRFPFDRLIRFYEFEEIATAFHDVERGETVKPVLKM